MEKTFSLHYAYHFEEMKEQGGGHKTFGLSKTYPVFLVEKKPSTSDITAGLCDNSRSFGFESTQMSSEEDEQEQEENSHVLESHRDNLLRNIMIIDD